MAAVNVLRLPGYSSTSSAAGIMRLKRLLKPPAKPVVLDFCRFAAMPRTFRISLPVVPISDGHPAFGQRAVFILLAAPYYSSRPER